MGHHPVKRYLTDLADGVRIVFTRKFWCDLRDYWAFWIDEAAQGRWSDWSGDTVPRATLKRALRDRADAEERGER